MEDIIEYAGELRQQLNDSNQIVQELYDKNIEALAHILHLQAENNALRSYQSDKSSTLDNRVKHLLDVIEAQQNQLRNLETFSRLKNVWKSILHIYGDCNNNYNNNSIYNTNSKAALNGDIDDTFSSVVNNTNGDDLAYIIALLSAKYANEVSITNRRHFTQGSAG